MKEKKMADVLNLADDKYVWEARPTPRRGRKRKLAVIAACLAVFVVSASLWLFVPYNTNPPDVSRYADSEYYDIIQQLNVLTYKKPKTRNNYETYASLFRSYKDAQAPTADGAVDMAETPAQANDYVEVTDNQVAGVIEGDIFKRSQSYLFSLYSNVLTVYSIAGMDSEEINCYVLPEETTTENGARAKYDYLEMYLSQDGRTITLLANQFSKNGELVCIMSLDVSDPTQITIKSQVSLTGSYNSSRMVNGKLLLIHEFYLQGSPDFSDESTFLPQIDVGSGMVSISAEDVILPDTLTSSRYTVISMFDEDTLTNQGFCALLSYSDEWYVSPTTVYATRQYSYGGSVVIDTDDIASYTVGRTVTEVARVDYAGEELKILDSFTVDGYVNDQYSMDEYEGTFRIVTTTSDASASLFCIDLTTNSTIGCVENFAPLGEHVESVRFDGTSAYVCTAVTLVTITDPVYFFDLSDPQNITYQDTGDIDGYSTSLIQLGDGFLLGIGTDGTGGSLKVEVYEKNPDVANGVASVDAWIMENASYPSNDYKCFLIDRENRLIGIPVYSVDSGVQYVLLHFDFYHVRPILQETISQWARTRATLIDGYLYILSGGELSVYNIDIL